MRALADWRRDAKVVQLTERILKLDTRDKLERVAKAVQIGGMLAAVRSGDTSVSGCDCGSPTRAC